TTCPTCSPPPPPPSGRAGGGGGRSASARRSWRALPSSPPPWGACRVSWVTPGSSCPTVTRRRCARPYRNSSPTPRRRRGGRRRRPAGALSCRERTTRCGRRWTPTPGRDLDGYLPSRLSRILPALGRGVSLRGSLVITVPPRSMGPPGLPARGLARAGETTGSQSCVPEVTQLTRYLVGLDQRQRLSTY